MTSLRRLRSSLSLWRGQSPDRLHRQHLALGSHSECQGLNPHLPDDPPRRPPQRRSKETFSSTVFTDVVAGHVSNVGEITGLECQELQCLSWPTIASERLRATQVDATDLPISSIMLPFRCYPRGFWPRDVCRSWGKRWMPSSLLATTTQSLRS